MPGYVSWRNIQPCRSFFVVAVRSTAGWLDGLKGGPRRGLRVWQGAPPYRGLQGLQLYYMRDGRSSVKALLAAWPCGRCSIGGQCPGNGSCRESSGIMRVQWRNQHPLSSVCEGWHAWPAKLIRQGCRSFCGAHEDLASERSFGQGNTLATKKFFDSLLAAGWLYRPAREPH